MAALGITSHNHPQSTRSAVRALACAIALALTVAWSATVLPSSAFAYYNEYDTANYAQQAIDVPGDPIPGGAIPDGVYLVGARTSSRMCILYPSAEDCEAKTNREMCYISVEGGNITAVFYISKAYTRLCMGTGEYAASLSDASGTNDAPYMVGDPADGYVPHLYTFPVNALNETITFAAFDGGTERGVTGAKWFTRSVAFTPTEDVMRAIRGESRDPEPQPADDSGNSQTSDDSQQGQAAAASTSSNNDSSGTGDGGANGAADSAPTDQPGEAESATAQATATAKRRGIPITVAELGVPDFVADIQQVEAVDTGPKGLTQAQLLGLLLVAGITAGCAARIVQFTRSKRKRV